MTNSATFAGVARRKISPPLGTPLFGYPTERAASEVADDLAATALVLRSGKTEAAVVSLDWCAVDEVETGRIRAAIYAKCGIVPEAITLCATHTHSGPTTIDCWGWGRRDEDYLESVRPSIVEAVAAAQAACQPVRIGTGGVRTRVGVNRRVVSLEGEVRFGFNEWGPVDRRLTVVRLEGEGGGVAQLVHLGAHPTCRGIDPAISRDWPGVMIDRMEAVTGTPVIFINGAFGDVAPRTSVRGSVGDGAAAMMEVGLRAAHDALAAWHSIREFHAGGVRLHHGTFEIPYASLEPLSVAEEALERLGPDAAHRRGEEGCLWNYWNAVRAAHAAPPRSGRPFGQTITFIGSTAIVPFGGEIFAEIALRLQDASPFETTLCAGTSNGAHGYYVTREARSRGGYEPWVGRAYGACLMREDVDDVLVRENTRLLREAAGCFNPVRELS